MEIIRNKYLTVISYVNSKLKISTKKYDDIVGIIDNNVPIFDSESNTYENGKIKFNDKYIWEKDMLEFSDMNQKLYLSSILNASSKFNIQNSFSYLILEEIDNILDDQIFADLINNADDIENLSKELADSYNTLIKKLILFDNEFNKYEFIEISKEEILEIINNKNSNIFWGKIKIKINLKSIIKNTKTWKNYQIGILNMIKNGKSEVLVDIINLKTEKLVMEQKKYGNSLLLTKRFQILFPMKTLSLNQENNNF